MNTRECRNCGKPLPEKAKHGPPKQYCSAVCRARHKDKRDKDKPKTDRPNGRLCYVCGKELTGKRTKQCTECLRAAGERKQQRIEEGKRRVTKVCEHCGNSYEAGKIVKNRKRFCSDECRNKKRQSERRYPFTCLNCGKPSTAAQKQYTRFCSRECAFESRSKRIALIRAEKKEAALAALEKECVQCGKKFRAKHLSQTLCSKECQLERGREKFREHKKVIGRQQGRIETLTCQHCGKGFKHKIYNQVPAYCSLKCTRKANKLRRRAMKYGNGPVENIPPWKVYERDGWRCGFCGKKVNPRLKYPHPLSASLDHIIALANGGTHTWTNVQCVHLKCNRDKSDKGGGQLRLGITHAK